MKKLIEKTWSYILYQTDDDNLILSVVCGTVGLYDVNIQLNDEEKDKFEKDGTEFIDELALDVSSNPPKYRNRHTQDIKK